MNPDIAIEYGQEAALQSLTLVAPLLIVGIVVAVLVGLLQSMTQIQDQTVSFVPKILCIALTFVLCLPWMSGRLIEYSKDLLERPRLINVNATSQSDRIRSGERESSLPETDKLARLKIQ